MYCNRTKTNQKVFHHWREIITYILLELDIHFVYFKVRAHCISSIGRALICNQGVFKVLFDSGGDIPHYNWSRTFCLMVICLSLLIQKSCGISSCSCVEKFGNYLTFIKESWLDGQTPRYDQKWCWNQCKTPNKQNLTFRLEGLRSNHAHFCYEN